MLSKLRIIAVTAGLRLFHPRTVSIKGFQDLRFNTELAVNHQGHIEFGKWTTAFRNVTFSANGGTIKIGDHAFFNRNCILVSLDQIIIGNRCIFGPNVVIYDHDHRFNADGIIEGEFKKSPVIIEDHCWIGANVTILRGTHIGEGCVIGAGSVIKGDIPAHSIVIGDRSALIKEIKDQEEHHH